MTIWVEAEIRLEKLLATAVDTIYGYEEIFIQKDIGFYAIIAIKLHHGEEHVPMNFWNKNKMSKNNLNKEILLKALDDIYYTNPVDKRPKQAYHQIRELIWKHGIIPQDRSTEK